MSEHRVLPLNPPAPALPVADGRHRSEGRRFTRDGDPALEGHIARLCDEVLARIRRVVPAGQLEGLLLGGGYGRGEGGVWKPFGCDRPYNDLEFYLFVRGNVWWTERRRASALRALSEEMSRAAGIEIEFKVLSSAKLRRSAPSMFYYDLVVGHHRIWGEERLLAGCDHHRQAGAIPLAEAARLLMNRCSGLLFAERLLLNQPFTGADADFVSRNVAKAKLAIGDALLTHHGQYHWSCLERRRRLAALVAHPQLNKDLRPWLSLVYSCHEQGVEFKLHPPPFPPPHSQLVAQHNQVKTVALAAWLWSENRRLGQHFDSAAQYALSQVDKCPDSPAWRNGLINLKTFGPAAWFRPHGCRYPRERLYHALVLLLWEPRALTDPSLLGRLQRDLRTRARSHGELISAYRRLWCCFR